ncbi:hypothetical protein N7535_002660 [Penicillium sp. DV-2018c]|nr:hypothetical protein N7535_002660 [Penicillium sp. DV-2018c]
MPLPSTRTLLSNHHQQPPNPNLPISQSPNLPILQNAPNPNLDPNPPNLRHPPPLLHSPTHPSLTCTIRLPHPHPQDPDSDKENHNPNPASTSTTKTTIKTWLNTNYFLWSISAAHAAHTSKTSPSNAWTQTFNYHHLPTWTEIQARVAEIENPYRFGIPIPEPPIAGAVVRHVTSAGAGAGAGAGERFVIRKEEMVRTAGLRVVSGLEVGRGEEEAWEEEEGTGRDEADGDFVLVGEGLDGSVGSLSDLDSGEYDSDAEVVPDVEGDCWKADVWEYLDGHDEFADEYAFSYGVEA